MIEAQPPRTPAELDAAIAAAVTAADRGLRRRPVAEIVRVIDAFAARWLAPAAGLDTAVDDLAASTGFSPAMLRHAWPLHFAPLRAAPLCAMLTDELGDPRVLDGVCGGRRAVGPRLITHVLPGNLPGLAAAPLALSLVAKSAVVLKAAAGDPLSPILLHRVLAAVDPEVAACVVVAQWPGGDAACETAAFGVSDLVVASGSDAAIAALHARVPGRFIGHGHRVSIAVVGRECLTDAQTSRDVAHRLAYDVSLWDQQGCLSPQLVYVEAGGGVAPDTFAGDLAAALAAWARTLPCRRTTVAEQVAVQQFRQDAEWAAEPRRVIASPGSIDWTVTVEPGGAFRPTCLHRSVRVIPIDEVLPTVRSLRAHRRWLEAAGVAVGPERRAVVTDALVESGVHRVCPLGTMQRPSLSWRQGGRPRLVEWLTWATVEAEDDAERGISEQ